MSEIAFGSPFRDSIVARASPFYGRNGGLPGRVPGVSGLAWKGREGLFYAGLGFYAMRLQYQTAREPECR